MRNILLSALFAISISAVVAQQKDIRPSNILTEDQKIYGLSKFWHEARENFIYINQVGIKKWDSIYQSYIPLARRTRNDWEYYKLLQRFCALLNDGHTSITRPPIRLDQTQGEKAGEVFLPERDGRFEEGLLIPLELDGKIVVARVNKKLGKEIPVGSRIHTVNNMPVEEYINRYTLPYVSQSTDYMRRTIAMRNIINGLYGDTLKLGYTKPDGQEASIKLTLGSTSSVNADGFDALYMLSNVPKELVDLDWYDGNIAYMKLNSFSDRKIIDDFKKILPDLYKAKGLIIDLRFNGGGNTYNGVEILQYFTPDGELYGAHSRSRMIVPTHSAWGDYTQAKDTIGNTEATKSYLAAQNELYMDFGTDTFIVNIDRKERLIIPTVILTGNSTASAAEDFLIYADNQKHIIRMGQKSYGSTGQPIPISLVGGLSARICTKEDTYPDGRKFVGVGIIPHIEIIPKLDNYLKGEDVEVDSAREYLKKELNKK